MLQSFISRNHRAFKALSQINPQLAKHIANSKHKGFLTESQDPETDPNKETKAGHPGKPGGATEMFNQLAKRKPRNYGKV